VFVPDKIVVDHSSQWHSINSPSPQSTFHSLTINFHLQDKIYSCQKPNSLFEMLQGHSYHLSIKERTEEGVGIIW
jgi:hypothetical protein